MIRPGVPYYKDRGGSFRADLYCASCGYSSRNDSRTAHCSIGLRLLRRVS